MSWSINRIGTPKKLIERVNNHAQDNNLSGASLEEWEAVKPNILGILEMNYAVKPEYDGVLHLEASGHAFISSEGSASNCFVSVKSLPGQLA